MSLAKVTEKAQKEPPGSTLDYQLALTASGGTLHQLFTAPESSQWIKHFPDMNSIRSVESVNEEDRGFMGQYSVDERFRELVPYGLPLVAEAIEHVVDQRRESLTQDRAIDRF